MPSSGHRPRISSPRRQCCQGQDQSLFLKGLQHLQHCQPLPIPESSVQPVLQVCLAGSQQGPVPSSFTGREDVNRGQGVGAGQRRPRSHLHCTRLTACSHHTPGGRRLAPWNPGLTHQVAACSATHCPSSLRFHVAPTFPLPPMPDSPGYNSVTHPPLQSQS